MTNIYAKVVLIAAAVVIAACSGGANTTKFPGTRDGARALLSEFLKNDTDRKKLTMELKPSKEDYRAFYKDEETAARAESFYERMWSSADTVVAPKDGQTEIKLAMATTEQLKDSDGEYAEFPTAMAAAAEVYLKPNQTLYAFKFVKPGESTGMAYEGLTHINGRWRLFPKPWRFTEAK